MAGALQLLGVLAAGGALAASGAFSWARDVLASVRDISRGSDEDAMARVERALAIADIVVLAAIADGELGEHELEAMRGQDIDGRASPAEAIARWRAQLGLAADLPALEATIAAIGRKLDEEERRLALRLVAEIEPGRVADRRPRAGAYRDASLRGEPVVALVARALGVPEEAAQR